MRKEFTDEQLDKMMQTLICDASGDENEIKDIAASPTVWWAIQREINAQKETAKSPWPPANIIRRWLLIGVPTLAAAGLIVSFVFFRSNPAVQEAQVPAAAPAATAPSTSDTNAASISVQEKPESAPLKAVADHNPVERNIRPTRAVGREQKRAASPLVASTEKKPEIKTEFISLTYARNADSGQIVRLKVPSSMMVSLGLVASVEKPADLVDAEVVVGDDGLTRAIRFIR